eukprot:3453408-Rhodomonas_salina.2
MKTKSLAPAKQHHHTCISSPCTQTQQSQQHAHIEARATQKRTGLHICDFSKSAEDPSNQVFADRQPCWIAAVGHSCSTTHSPLTT